MEQIPNGVIHRFKKECDSIEMIIWFLFFFVDIVYYTLICRY